MNAQIDDLLKIIGEQAVMLRLLEEELRRLKAQQDKIKAADVAQ